MNDPLPILDKESVVRILHNDWVVDNDLQLGAFTLRPNETYISVNRPSVESFMSDVTSFVDSHPSYQHTETTYRCAKLSVKDVRNIEVLHQGTPLNIDVEVEPRTSHVASHAGIFTRMGTTNIKQGSTLPAEALPLGLSADDILMEIGWSLIALSTIEERTFLME